MTFKSIHSLSSLLLSQQIQNNLNPFLHRGEKNSVLEHSIQYSFLAVVSDLIVKKGSGKIVCRGRILCSIPAFNSIQFNFWSVFSIICTHILMGVITMADFEPLVRRRDVLDVDADVEQQHHLRQAPPQYYRVDDYDDQRFEPRKISASNTNTNTMRNSTCRPITNPNPRVASLDVLRGLSVFFMILVDYGGSILPIIAHSPWNGLHLADFVMPFFLFVAGVSLAIVYKKVSDRKKATWKVVLRALKLFLLGILLQGGYLHGITSMTYGVDIERIRWLGILQRIAVAYLVAALCEIWLPCRKLRKEGFIRNYHWHWCIALLLSALYLGLLYGLYVPNWQFSPANNSEIYEVKCSVRGDLGPDCNSAGMVDRYVLGINHLYAKPVYRNLKECKVSNNHQFNQSVPSWCLAPSEPEGILSSLTAAVTCIIGLHYGHILVQLQDHKERLYNWSLFSVLFMALGLLLSFLGMPLNKSMYTISYLLVTSGSAGITFCLLYVLVDVYGWRWVTFMLEWVGKHALSIFIIVTSNIAVIMVQGFYWRAPENNIVHWIVTRVVHRK